MPDKRDINEEITARIMAALERGTVPWRKPWTSDGILPTSATTGKAYRGVNVWLLSLTAMERGYASAYWLTFKQAQAFGGSVRRGEKGTAVVFYKMLDVADKVDPDKRKRIPLMRSFTVFNAEQCDGLTMPERFTPKERTPVEIDICAESILARYFTGDGPKLAHGGATAFYRPSTDVVTLPDRDTFEDGAGYYSTAYHEATHSTGHVSRLDRFGANGEPQHFGTTRYAREELVAEMGAAILCATAGLEPRIDQNAAYIASWLTVLAEDSTLVVKASAQAQKATDTILGVTYAVAPQQEEVTV